MDVWREPVEERVEVARRRPQLTSQPVTNGRLRRWPGCDDHLRGSAPGVGVVISELLAHLGELSHGERFRFSR